MKANIKTFLDTYLTKEERLARAENQLGLAKEHLKLTKLEVSDWEQALEEMKQGKYETEENENVK
jgi:hypothetical protein